jgi:hypothetical protein
MDSMSAKTMTFHLNEPNKPQNIRDKFRDIFGREITMSDEALMQRYRVSGEGDLIMILR